MLFRGERILKTDDQSLRQAILTFARFLSVSWEVVLPVLREEFADPRDSLSVAAWMQANWEQMVELPLLGRGHSMQPYGEGADFLAKGTRVLDPELDSDTVLQVHSPFGSELIDVMTGTSVSASAFRFYCLACARGQYWFLEPPFDHVVCVDKEWNEYLFSIGDVEFHIAPDRRKG